MQVSDFNLLITGDDFQRNNLYSIEIGMPNGQAGLNFFGDFYNDADQAHIQKSLSYMAKSVSIPSKAIGTIDAKRFGPIYKVANDLIIDTVTMTFMLSEDWREHKFFDGWLSGIMGKVKKGTGSTRYGSDGFNRQLYTLSYYADYISTVNIIPLDRQGGRATTIQLRNAYPTNLGPVEMNWSDAGEVATFNVTWSFHDWNHEEIDGYWADTSDLPSGATKEALVAQSAKHTRADYNINRAQLNKLHKGNEEAEDVRTSSNHTRLDYWTHKADVSRVAMENKLTGVSTSAKMRPEYKTHRADVKRKQIELAQKEAEAVAKMSGRHLGHT